MPVYYIDTNVFLDVVLNRENLFGKDISTTSYKVFSESMSCKFKLAISSWTLQEIYKKTEVEQMRMFFALIEKKIVTITYDYEDISKAKNMSNDNFDDALHIVLAEKCAVDKIVTRNIRDFIEIGTKIPIIKPESI